MTEQTPSSSARARSRERYKRAAFTTLSAGGAKGLALVAQLVTLPMTLGYLGTERFGLWSAMTSFVMFASFAELGIGNGVLSAISSAHGRGDREEIRRTLSTGIVLHGAIACAIAGTFALVQPFIDWGRFFNVRDPAAVAEIGPSVLMLVCIFAFSLPIMLVQRAQLGIQQGFVGNVWQALGSLLTIPTVLFLIGRHATLPWLVAGIALTPLVGALGNAIHFFLANPQLRPRGSCVSRERARLLIGTGSLFLVLQIVSTITFASDGVIIARLLGASAVTDYVLPDKLFSLIPFVIVIVLMPLWPAYGEAISRGDAGWVTRTLRLSLLGTVAFASLAVIVLVLLGPQILTLWLGRAIAVPLLLLASMACWRVVEAAGNAASYFLNGVGVVRPQAILAVITAVVAIPLKFALITRVGVAGAVLATLISYLAVTALPLYRITATALRGVQRPPTAEYACSTPQ